MCENFVPTYFCHGRHSALIFASRIICYSIALTWVCKSLFLDCDNKSKMILFLYLNDTTVYRCVRNVVCILFATNYYH